MCIQPRDLTCGGGGLARLLGFAQGLRVLAIALLAFLPVILWLFDLDVSTPAGALVVRPPRVPG